MPFLDEDLDNVPEESPVPSGEYDLRIVSAEAARTKNDDRDMIVVTLAVESAEHPAAGVFRNWLVLPNNDDKEKDNGRLAKMFYRNVKRFCHLFSIPYDFESVEDFAGCTGRAFVNLGVNSDTGQEFNTLQVPRLPRDDG